MKKKITQNRIREDPMGRTARGRLQDHKPQKRESLRIRRHIQLDRKWPLHLHLATLQQMSAWLLVTSLLIRSKNSCFSRCSRKNVKLEISRVRYDLNLLLLNSQHRTLQSSVLNCCSFQILLNLLKHYLSLQFRSHLAKWRYLIWRWMNSKTESRREDQIQTTTKT